LAVQLAVLCVEVYVREILDDETRALKISIEGQEMIAGLFNNKHN
jgi:hypothetical protein